MESKYSSAALGGSKPQPGGRSTRHPENASSASEPYWYFPRPGYLIRLFIKGAHL